MFTGECFEFSKMLGKYNCHVLPVDVYYSFESDNSVSGKLKFTNKSIENGKIISLYFKLIKGFETNFGEFCFLVNF